MIIERPDSRTRIPGPLFSLPLTLLLPQLSSPSIDLVKPSPGLSARRQSRTDRRVNQVGGRPRRLSPSGPVWRHSDYGQDAVGPEGNTRGPEDSRGFYRPRRSANFPQPRSLGWPPRDANTRVPLRRNVPPKVTQRLGSFQKDGTRTVNNVKGLLCGALGSTGSDQAAYELARGRVFFLLLC